MDNVLKFTNTHNSIIGALALAATLVGFFWTLIRLYVDRNEMTVAQKAIKQAQEEANTAIRSAQEDIAETKASVLNIKNNLFRFDAISEISSVIAALREIRRMQLEGSDNWMMILERYSTTRGSLVQVNAVQGLLNSQQQSVIQEAVVQIRTSHEKVEKSVLNKENPKSVSNLNKILSEQIDGLSVVLTELKNMDLNQDV